MTVQSMRTRAKRAYKAAGLGENGLQPYLVFITPAEKAGAWKVREDYQSGKRRVEYRIFEVEDLNAHLERAGYTCTVIVDDI